ncbi:MAG: RidA family protein [Hyphomicrobiales bacterium]|nr:RidA family protein [Hyphomicrobiales bacterium]
MNSIERKRLVPDIPEPTGPWNWRVTWNGLVFVSGIRGIDLLTGEPAESHEKRLELIFQHMGRILADAGSSLHHVMSSTVYVTDMAALRPLVNDAYVKVFADNLPTRTIIEVAGLNQNDSIEIEIVAIQTSAAR